MKVVNAVTIGKLIEAYYEGNNEKFNSYANFIADGGTRGFKVGKYNKG